MTQKESFSTQAVQSTRRTLLKTGAAGVAAGAATVWSTRSTPAAFIGGRAGTASAAMKNQTAADSGLSQAKLEQMHEIMAGHVDDGEAPGLVTVVSRHGETFVDPIGTTAVGGDDPMQRDAIFRMASMTKPVTAVAALILVEECVLRLDDPIDTLLPELADRQVLKSIDGPLDETVPANRPITLRDLLTFRLGIGMVFNGEPTPIQQAMEKQVIGWVPDPQLMPEPDEWLKRLGSLPLMYQPGERWLYNTGSDVLGVLIARASGQTLDAFMRERIFDPLGMKDTGFSVPADKRDRLSSVYFPNAETGELDLFENATNSSWNTLPAFQAGASGLVSTADDYLAFAQMLLNQGKLGNERVISRPSVEVMTTDQLTPEQKAASDSFPGFWDNHGWGFGVSIVTRRDSAPDTLGKYGWDGAFGTSFRVDPVEDMITILLTQVGFASTGIATMAPDLETSSYAAIDD